MIGMAAEQIPQQAMSWAEANRAFLEKALEALRLRLHRYILWLRQGWQQDPLRDYQNLVISDAQADRLLQSRPAAEAGRFYRQNQQAARLSRRLGECEAEMQTLAEQMSLQAGAPALANLSALFGLGRYEQDLLLLALAPQLDPAFEQLFAYAQDSVSRTRPSRQLALRLYTDRADSPESAWDSLLPSSPLARFCFIDSQGGGVQPSEAFALALDKRITNYLLGANQIDERVAPILRPVPLAPDLPPAQRRLAERLEQALKRRQDDQEVPLINLVGGPGAGRRAVAGRVCQRLGLRLGRIDCRRLPAAGTERFRCYRLLEREAVLLPVAWYIDCSDIDPHDRAETAAVSEAVESIGTLGFLGSRHPWRAERRLVTVEVPRCDAADQVTLWKSALSAESGEGQDISAGQLQRLVQQFDFGPEAVQQTVAAALELARLRGPQDPKLSPQDLWRAGRLRAAQPMRGLAQKLEPCYSWEDIVLPADLQAHLREVAAQVANRIRVYEEWGFGAKLTRGRGISALFAGPSGTGKTMAAEVLANHLQLDLYRIDLSAVVSKYIGETEKSLRQVFDAAEQSGAILFFDEADALFGKRIEVKDSHDRYANIEVNYLLQRMEDYRGLAILATNRKSHLDEAFLRRLRFQLDFPLPDASLRRLIWEKSFPPEAEMGELDFDFLPRLEIPGGNIRNIALNAAFLAADENRPIDLEHVLKATRREYAKIERLISEAEFGLCYQRVKG